MHRPTKLVRTRKWWQISLLVLKQACWVPALFTASAWVKGGCSGGTATLQIKLDRSRPKRTTFVFKMYTSANDWLNRTRELQQSPLVSGLCEVCVRARQSWHRTKYIGAMCGGRFTGFWNFPSPTPNKLEICPFLWRVLDFLGDPPCQASSLWSLVHE